MRDKSTAAFLAFCLGIFGVHRFYLDEAGAGVAYLLGLLFCLPLPMLFSVIDGFHYLSMSNEEFNLRYNVAHGMVGGPIQTQTKVTIRKTVIGPDGVRREVVEERVTGPASAMRMPRRPGGAMADYQVRRPRDDAEAERFILQAAADHAGDLTAAELVRMSQLGLSEARDGLDHLHAQGICDLDVDGEGLVHYQFPEFLPAEPSGRRMTGQAGSIDEDLHAL